MTIKPDEKNKFLYVTREKFPTYRVDLTELFSKGIAEHGFYIDWHMQGINSTPSVFKRINNNESIYVGRYIKSDKFLFKIVNHFFSLLHDFRIFNLVKNNDYTFVQVRDKILAAWIGLKAAQKKNVPFIYWMSFPYPEADLYRSQDFSMELPVYMRWFYKLRGSVTTYILYKRVLPQADKIFVQSDRMLEDVSQHNIDKQKMFPVPMGINLDDLDMSPLPHLSVDILKNRKVLIYMGTMVKVRRIDFLLDMLKLLLKTKPEVVLLLVGDAPEKDMNFLKQRTEELSLKDNVIFTGFIPMKAAWAYVNHSDICLSPFRPSPILDSTSPTKIIEYLAWQKPVVANKHPDQSKVLNESGAGYAVDYTPEAFAKVCIELLNNPEKAKQMGKKGYDYVKKNRTYKILSEQLRNQYFQMFETEL